MKKKLTIIISSVLAVVFALGMFAGCDLITTDNEKDMAQVVAEVNIGNDRESLDTSFTAFSGKTLSLTDEQIAQIVSTDEIYKRDLVTYFLNYGYSYVTSGGYTYAQTFEMLMDALTQRKIIAQFASLYYLNEGYVAVDRDNVDSLNGYGEPVNGTDEVRMSKEISVSGYLAAIADKTGDQASIAGYEYFLTEDEINYARYSVMLSINNSIDTYEQEIIAAESEDSASDESRTVPTGANEISSSYYPNTEVDGQKVIDYDVYTGNNLVSECGTYQKVDGSTAVTRRRAYNRFLSSLNRNYLIESGEDISDITQLSYFAIEYKNQLEQQVINKFSATIALDMTERWESDNLTTAYNLLVNEQKVSSQSDFTTTMDSVSDSSFVVYSREKRTYGFVYNILLPFDAEQEMELDELQSRYGSDTKEYYAARNKLFENIAGSDQRSTWFNGSEDYSFDASETNLAYYTEPNGEQQKSSYLFFEDSYVNSDEGIDRYAGKYPYNGTVVPNNDGSYTLTPHELKIDAFIAEVEGYINYIVGGDTPAASGSKYEPLSGKTFYDYTAQDFLQSDGRTIDYSKTIYYTGKVAGVSDVSAAEWMVKESVSYKALSAFNELMFAYSTDTGCLNTYLGYSINAKEDSTDYVAEFEYAAQQAINLNNDLGDGMGGAGAYYVVGTDFGWHILYVSFVYTGGEVYADSDPAKSGFVYADRMKEGTFSYYFYQTMKDSALEDFTSEKQDYILTKLDNDSAVVVYESRYSDLTDIQA